VTNSKPWWSTQIVSSSVDEISICGYPVDELIGEVSYAEMLWLAVHQQLPDPGAARLLDAVLVGGADFGPHAPSIAAARMAATCGVPMNGVMATGMGMLGDVHGGAIEQCGELLLQIREAGGDRRAALQLIRPIIGAGRYIPGFGHRFFKEKDPRAAKMKDLVEAARDSQVISGWTVPLLASLEEAIHEVLKQSLPINLDGMSAAILVELGFPVASFRGVFCLSRGIGILAEALEEMRSGSRLKGPVPAAGGHVHYEGPSTRHLRD